MIAYKNSATWCAAFFLSIAAVDGSAQEFPTRPVKIMVPSPPGSGTDILARLLAGLLSRRWQSPVFLENGSGVATGNLRQRRSRGISHVVIASAAKFDSEFAPRRE